jgi:hypothetical protein
MSGTNWAISFDPTKTRPYMLTKDGEMWKRFFTKEDAVRYIAQRGMWLGIHPDLCGHLCDDSIEGGQVHGAD